MTKYQSQRLSKHQSLDFILDIQDKWQFAVYPAGLLTCSTLVQYMHGTQRKTSKYQPRHFHLLHSKFYSKLFGHAEEVTSIVIRPILILLHAVIRYYNLFITTFCSGLTTKLNRSYE